MTEHARKHAYATAGEVADEESEIYRAAMAVAGPGGIEHPTIGLEGRVGTERSRGDKWHGATTIRAMWHGEVM